MTLKALIIFLSTFQGLLFTLHAQEMSSQVNGTINGTVKDSIGRSSISSATATVYNESDSSIISYSFTNNNGDFKFENLPFDTDLSIKISHVGYVPFEKSLRLSIRSANINVSNIFLVKKSEDLNEVIVVAKRPPLMMRGDTLEINAEAFITKKNAVVEDLLRKVPGVVVWSDGKITVNGKPVSQLLVEGKPFFGGDPVIAIRNLPKDAVDKVKVYDDSTANYDLNIDPKVIMDISLKTNKKKGIFGKTSLGKGTSDRFEGNLSLNAFSPKNQTSAFVATNNTNKQAYDVSTILRQSVYKPGGSDNFVYQSDFSMQGLNQFTAAGVNVEHDWSKSRNAGGEYFALGTKNMTERKVQEITSVSDDIIKKNVESKNDSKKQSHRFSGNFKDVTTNHELYFKPYLQIEKKKIDERDQQITSNEEEELLNESKHMSERETDESKLALEIEYRKKNNSNLTQPFMVAYNLNYSGITYHETSKSSFSTFSDDMPAPNNLLDRQIHARENSLDQRLYGEIDLKEILNYKGNIRSKFTNTLYHLGFNDDRNVNNFDQNTNSYVSVDSNLTNKSQYNYLEGKPGLEISFSKEERGLRERKNFTYSLKLELQGISQDNKSSKPFQRIERKYASFFPSFMARYNIDKQGRFTRSYRISYSTQAEVPSISQLAPLIDTVNRSLIYLGNRNLQKQYQHEIQINYLSYKSNNGGSLRVDLRTGMIRDKMVDSSIYDAIGRQVSYTVNSDGYRYANFSLSYQKSTLLLDNPISFNFYPRVNWSTNPYYIDGDKRYSRNFYSSLSVLANFTLNELIQLDINGSVNFQRNKLTAKAEDKLFTSLGRYIGGALQVSWPKSFTLVNSLYYRRNSNIYDDGVQALTWNLNIYYRMLKKEQLELKFTATDLLNQRTNVIRYMNNNSIGSGTANNLKQFFMISLSYFPRQFGAKK